ncbi:MAG: hypothetical protein JO218_18345, partial [Burkholderiales bacterium]|nr:hypothetical protein [Burkholderiales bacterium]
MPATYDITGHLFSVQPLATCSKDLRDRAGGPEKPVPVPSMQFGSEAVHLYFPGTGIRGTLRRAARDVLRARESARCGNPKPFSLDQHYLLTLGGIKGVAEANRASVAVEAAWRERNPLLSLFGAGDAGVLGFVEGRLSVGNAICDKPCEPVVFSGARTDDLYRDKAQLAYLSDEDLDSLVARSQGNRSRAALQRQLKDLEGALKRNRGDVEKAEGLRAQIAE